MTDTHALRRTNLKGVPFIGACIKCGKENLSATAAREPCPNPGGMPEEIGLLKLVRGDD